jgi:hypothetical protein
MALWFWVLIISHLAWAIVPPDVVCSLGDQRVVWTAGTGAVAVYGSAGQLAWSSDVGVPMLQAEAVVQEVTQYSGDFIIKQSVQLRSQTQTVDTAVCESVRRVVGW